MTYHVKSKHFWLVKTEFLENPTFDFGKNFIVQPSKMLFFDEAIFSGDKMTDKKIFADEVLVRSK